MILLVPPFNSEFPSIKAPGAAQLVRYLFADLHAGQWMIGTTNRKGETQWSQKSKEFVEMGAEVYANP